jgi:hypothetical protein
LTCQLGSGQEAPSAEDEIAAQRAQVEETRANMSGTIDAIQQKLSPENLAQQAKNTVRDATVGKVGGAVGTATDKMQQAAGSATGAAGSVGTTIVETIKQNPVPAALAGIGLGWLIAESRRSSASRTVSPGYRTYPTPYNAQAYPPATGYGSAAVYRPTEAAYPPPDFGSQESSPGSVDQAQQTASQAMDTVQSAAGQVQDTAGQMANRAQAQVSQLGGQAQQQLQQASSGFSRMMQERPLAVGALAVAVGAAVGLAIPETRQEGELMGPARDTVMQRAQQTFQDTAQKVETVAQEALGTVKDEAQKQGLGQSSS